MHCAPAANEGIAPQLSRRWWLRASSFALPCPPTPRMMLLVNPIQPVEREMRIDLRCRNVGMAEDGLHRAQIGAIFHHVSGATVAQHVRAGMTHRLSGRVIHYLPYPLSGDVPRPARDEQERRRRCVRQQWARMLQI